MKAVVFKEIGKVAVEEVPKPDLNTPADAIVKVTAAAICRTDIKILHGWAYGDYKHKPGLIFGHEGVGVVEEVGEEVKKFRPGDRVIISNNVQCGSCFYCLQGRYALCENGGWVLAHTENGTHAEYVRIPYADMGLHKIPEGLSDEDVMGVMDILSTGMFAVENAETKPGDIVAVIGAGGVGQCVIMLAKLFGASLVIAVDTVDHRLELAKKMGADVVINPKTEDPVGKIMAISDGRGADCAIEVVGVKETLEYALKSVRPCGHVSIIGIFAEPQTVPIDIIQLKSLTIRSGYVDTNRIPKILRLVQHGKINTRAIFTHTFPLVEAPKAYEIFDKGLDNVVKVILKP